MINFIVQVVSAFLFFMSAVLFGVSVFTHDQFSAQVGLLAVSLAVATTFFFKDAP